MMNKLFARPTLLELEDAFAERAGKKRAGRLLDGREWSQFPTPRTAQVEVPA